jgi:hypothetical protein
VDAVIQFASLADDIKKQYTPNRDAGDNEGYEIGAEWFKNDKGEWQIDNKKASYYAFVPDDVRNKWPREVDLKLHYLALGELIFNTGKLLLNTIGLNETIGLKHALLKGYGRMLHYHQENTPNGNDDWCGAHYDHSLFTGLMPAYYFRDGKEIAAPDEAGLFVSPNNGDGFEKVSASDKSIMLFQVGEFGQIVSDDRIRATKHMVKQAFNGVERIAFALFYQPNDDFVIQSKSVFAKDPRYVQAQFADGSISYANWDKATIDSYRAK